jgi:predicted PurR-regulated permease PerM
VILPDAGNQRFFERAIGLSLIASLVAACVWVTLPLLVPLLWALVLTVAVWPVYAWLCRRLHGHRKTAATLTSLLIFLAAALPTGLLIASLADNARALGGIFQRLTGHGPPQPPAFLVTLPIIGTLIEAAWREATVNVGVVVEQVQPYIGRATGWLLVRGADFGLAVIQFLSAILLSGVLFVTGEAAASVMRRFVARIGSAREVALLNLAGLTIRGVAIGVIGTAFAQSLLAGMGLFIAGAPGKVLLSFIVFLVAVLQLPTALILLPVGGWLIWDGSTWQGIFLAVWSMTLVNTVDNLVRPYLISQGAKLPFLLTMLGAIGGLLAWGFLGLFLGPTLLGVAYTLFHNWLDDDRVGGPRPRLLLPDDVESTR